MKKILLSAIFLCAACSALQCRASDYDPTAIHDRGSQKLIGSLQVTGSLRAGSMEAQAARANSVVSQGDISAAGNIYSAGIRTDVIKSKTNSGLSIDVQTDFTSVPTVNGTPLTAGDSPIERVDAAGHLATITIVYDPDAQLDATQSQCKNNFMNAISGALGVSSYNLESSTYCATAAGTKTCEYKIYTTNVADLESLSTVPPAFASGSNCTWAASADMSSAAVTTVIARPKPAIQHTMLPVYTPDAIPDCNRHFQGSMAVIDNYDAEESIYGGGDMVVCLCSGHNAGDSGWPVAALECAWKKVSTYSY